MIRVPGVLGKHSAWFSSFVRVFSSSSVAIGERLNRHGKKNCISPNQTEAAPAIIPAPDLAIAPNHRESVAVGRIQHHKTVDHDIDPTNIDEVMWAICTRSDPGLQLQSVYPEVRLYR